MRDIYVLPILGAVVGGLSFLGVLLTAQSAPQQAAGAAMACAWALLPYIFARSMVEYRERPAQPPQPARPGTTIQPPPPPRTPEERATERRRIVRWIVAGAVILAALFAVAVVVHFLTPPREPGFYDRYPSAP